MNNAVFGKTVENVRKHGDIKLSTAKKWKNYLVPEPNYHTSKFFTENFLAREMKKTQTLMNKPAYLGLSIQKLSKMLMYDFWYDYVKPKYGEKVKLHYMDTESFIACIKTDYIYKDFAEDVETRCDTVNYEFNRPLPKGKNKRSNWINERWISKNDDKTYWTKSKNL